MKKAALTIAVFTLSWDLLLVVETGGFTLRLSQVAFLLALLFALMNRVIDPRAPRLVVVTPLTWALLGYFLSSLISIWKSQDPFRSILYLTWYVFDYIAIYLVVLNFVTGSRRLIYLLKVHFLGILCAVFYGHAQLGFSAVGVVLPLTKQTIGPFMRPNAFNYEPSYFAFYILTGMYCAICLALYNIEVFRMLRSRTIAGLTTMGLLISTSLSGWVSGAVGFAYLFIFSGEWFFHRRKLLHLIVGLLLIFLALIGGISMLWPDLLGTIVPRVTAKFDVREASSAAPRMASVLLGFREINKSWLLGNGYASAKNNITNLWAETLYEQGSLGFLALLFIVISTVRLLNNAKKLASSQLEICLAQGYKITFLTLMLITFQFNQNFNRQDIFFLLAMLTGLHYIIKNNSEKNMCALEPRHHSQEISLS